ncbi:hypothetical protein HPP92_023399 [Vanilla planifolia]|uniref:Uncharacterized protein n=1 Tax=Vanilla planifolia TaxID=51239 RepID=A0A835UI60_VANPL|nr:hypothetical protein HPP92_023399 [Vanilla planifolia]
MRCVVCRHDEEEFCRFKWRQEASEELDGGEGLFGGHLITELSDRKFGNFCQVMLWTVGNQTTVIHLPAFRQDSSAMAVLVITAKLRKGNGVRWVIAQEEEEEGGGCKTGARAPSRIILLNQG